MIEKIPKIFGTDGVRGHANQYPMTVEIALALGRAMGAFFRKAPGKKRVIIGKDTRLSCYMFENALIAGLCSMGVDTLMLGPFPTPGVAFITRAYRANAGVVISASHNSYWDNGIKFFSSDGFKFPDSWEAEIEELVHKNDFGSTLPTDDEIGRNRRIYDVDGRYIEFCKATFPRSLSLSSLKIVLDCSNGAAYKVAPLILKELDANLFLLACEPNGFNINKDCGSLSLSNAKKSVIEQKADVGIALDGDADRVILLDELGQVVDGDTILGIAAVNMKQNGLLKNNRIVSTVMSNFGFLKSMEEAGIEVVQAPVGDRYVIQEMLKNDVILGGEQSGHTIFLDHNTTGDGIVAALQVLRIMIETGSKLSTLAATIKNFPQVQLNLKVKNKPPLQELKLTEKCIHAAKQKLENQGSVLVRYSGTEKILRITVQGQSQKLIEGLAKDIAEQAVKEIESMSKD